MCWEGLRGEMRGMTQLESRKYALRAGARLYESHLAQPIKSAQQGSVEAGICRESDANYYKTRKVLLVLDATGEPCGLPNARCETGLSRPRTRLTM